MSSTIGDQSELAVAVTPTVAGRLQPDGSVAAPIPEPHVLWTVLTTLFFGIFGAIAAAIQSSKASTLGYNPAKPWIAFGITLLPANTTCSMATASWEVLMSMARPQVSGS